MSWRLERVAGLVLARCAALAAVPAIAHAFSTRIDERGNAFDLATADPARFLSAAGLPGTRASDLRQVHGNRVVRSASCAEREPADASFWIEGDPPPRIPSVRFADCVPILIAERHGCAVVAVHAGWRGTAADVARRAVAELVLHGIDPENLIAALGPAILACCYEVGPEVAAALPDSMRDRRLDLHDANRRQLVAQGVPDRAIHAAPWCTRCRGDLFFSHRRERERSGRMMAAVGPGRP